MTEKDFEFIPGVGLGPIKFGELPNPLLDELGAVIDADASTDIDLSYELKNYEIIFSAENNFLYGITSWDYFFYNGENIIGQKLVDVRKLFLPSKFLKAQTITLENGSLMQFYDCDQLGCVLTIMDDDGLIYNASCNDLSKENAAK